MSLAMEILSPLNQSILQWDKTCQDESVDNFDLALSISGSLDNGDGYMDHTFHTPSFGDEEFDIPPINLQPTTPSSDTNSSDVYGSTQPLSHQEQPTQQQQSASSHQQLMMSPPPKMESPSPCSQHQTAVGAVMTAVTTAPSPPAPPMTSYANHNGQQHMGGQYMGGPADTYMLQIGAMMPPQSVQFQVQQYSLPNGYSPSMQQQLHMSPPQHHQMPQQHHMLMQQHHHQQQQQHHHTMQQQHHHQLLPPSPMLALQLSGPPRQRPGSVGSSPPVSNHTSPGLETSEDSDDSGHLSQLLCGLKRPSPEPVERPPSVGKPVKKPKVQKKKKKRDPNEPQKPVSAYALFFRDTQAAIKGQNPNASFGEVSKIVASMWDALELDHKNVYKKKTEVAKKEYLKALAAYRASLVSKAANDQSDNIYGSGGPNGTTPTSMSSQALSPLQKKSPLLTSLMEGAPVSSLQNMTQPQSMIMGQSPMNGVHHQHMLHHSAQPTHQMLHQMLSPQQQQGGAAAQQMMHMGSPPPIVMPHHGMHPLAATNPNSLSYSNNMSPQLSHQQQGMMCGSPLQGCPAPRNGGEPPQEWKSEFCNNDCVVSHCRDVFTTWVASRPPQNSYASVK